MVLNRRIRTAALVLAPILLASGPVASSAQTDATGVASGAVHIAAATSPLPESSLLEDPSGWRSVPLTPVHLNRTPPLYEGDPLDDGFRPDAFVSFVRLSDAFLVRLVWTDATGTPPAPPVRMPDAGEASIYKEHSVGVEQFADAACVMVPKPGADPETFPSLMMGDPGHAVDLYFWHQVKGARILEASGRSTTEATGATFPANARRTETGWDVIFELPAVPSGMPLSFAVWDGARDQRDGLKYYSLWCVAD